MWNTRNTLGSVRWLGWSLGPYDHIENAYSVVFGWNKVYVHTHFNPFWMHGKLLRCRSDREMQAVLQSGFTLQVKLVVSNFGNPGPPSWSQQSTHWVMAGFEHPGKEQSSCSWRSQSKSIQGLWFLWMALREKGGEMCEFRMKSKMKWSVAVAVTHLVLRCEKEAWEQWVTFLGSVRNNVPEEFFCSAQTWGNSRGSYRSTCNCFACRGNQMLLTGDLVRCCGFSFPSILFVGSTS